MSNTETRRDQRSEVRGQKPSIRRRVLLCLLVAACCLVAIGCRQDMQDQPRYEVYEPSKSFADGQSSRPYVEGTVARGYRDINTSYYTGKRTGATTGGAAQGLMNGGALQTTMANAQGANAGAQSTGSGDVNARGQNAGANVPGSTGGAGGTATGGGGGASSAQSGTPGSVNEFPFPVTEKDLDRGGERFGIYCAMCHGQTGYGDGMIVRRGFRRPPSFHDDRLRGETVGHFFDVITNGWGAMPDYAQQIPVEDRWKIIAYIRALQLSQNTPAASVPEELRRQRKDAPGTPTTEGGHQGTGGERTP
ncbi:MAG TPA: cytochrome c [Pyrinomonadaceae bacterium]|nr:cytochrome c [Pyrinomonadaceae bacterium]